MRILYLAILLCGSFSSKAQLCDYNEQLGVHEGIIKDLSKYASTKYSRDQTFFPTIPNVTPFEVVLLMATGKFKQLKELEEKASAQKEAGQKVTVKVPVQWKKEVGIWWNEIGHKIYCFAQGLDIAYSGYINFHLLKTGQMATIGKLYNPNGSYKFDLNLIVPLDPCNPDSPGATFIDIIEDGIKNPVGQMRSGRGITDNFKYFLDYFTKEYDGRKACEVLGTCTDKYTYALNGMFVKNMRNEESENRYNTLLESDPKFKIEYEYYHNLLKLIDSKDLENMNEIGALHYNFSSDYSKSSIQPIGLSVLGKGRKKTVNSVCEILNKYSINGFIYQNNPDDSSKTRDEPKTIIKCN